MSIKNYFILLFILLIFINPFVVNAKDLDYYDNLKQTLTNEIGETNATALFQSLEEKLIYLREIEASLDIMSDSIDEISSNYGVLFTFEQKSKLIEYYEENLTEDLLSGFWKWMQGLYEKSEVSVEHNVTSDKLIETNGEEVTIYLPNVETFDKFINKAIEVIRQYIDI